MIRLKLSQLPLNSGDEFEMVECPNCGELETLEYFHENSWCSKCDEEEENLNKNAAITKRTNIENRLLNLWSKIAVFTEQLTEISREIIEIQKEISSSPLVVDRGVQ